MFNICVSIFYFQHKQKYKISGQTLFAKKCSQWETQSITTSCCFYIYVCVWIQQKIKTDWLTLEFLVDIRHFFNLDWARFDVLPALSFFMWSLTNGPQLQLCTLYLVLIFLYNAGKKINLSIIPIYCITSDLYWPLCFF